MFNKPQVVIDLDEYNDLKAKAKVNSDENIIAYRKVVAGLYNFISQHSTTFGMRPQLLDEYLPKDVEILKQSDIMPLTAESIYVRPKQL